MKIDWKQIWIDLDDWEKEETERCPKCNSVTDEPVWPEWQDKVQTLVEAQLRGKRRGKP